MVDCRVRGALADGGNDVYSASDERLPRFFYPIEGYDSGDITVGLLRNPMLVRVRDISTIELGLTLSLHC